MKISGLEGEFYNTTCEYFLQVSGNDGKFQTRRLYAEVRLKVLNHKQTLMPALATTWEWEVGEISLEFLQELSHSNINRTC